MSLVDILKYVLPSGLAGGLVVLIVVFLYPEKVEKWAVLFYRLASYLFNVGEKRIVAHDIQGRVNDFSKRLAGNLPGTTPIGVKVEWVTEDETPESFFGKDRVVIRMRQHRDQDKNFVYAGMAFISTTVLPRCKKYLSRTQKEAIDLHVARRLLEAEKPAVIDRFVEEFFSERAISNARLMELLEKYNIIDTAGLFFPVLAQELRFLGQKVFYGPKKQGVIQEVKRFIEFLVVYAQRETGDEDISQTFDGTYCRCGIVIVGKPAKVRAGDWKPYVGYMRILVETRKLESIYILGPVSREHRLFVDEISKEATAQLNLSQVYNRTYKRQIKVMGEQRKVSTLIVCLRVPTERRYFGEDYQKTLIESGEG